MLTSWLKKEPKEKYVKYESTICPPTTSDDKNFSDDTTLEEKETIEETFENEVTSPSTILNDDNEFSNDIGDYLKQKDTIISDYKKAKTIELSNIPANDFIYPFSLHIKISSRNNILTSWLENGKFGEHDETNEIEVKTELHLWKSKWTGEKNEEKNCIKNLDAVSSAEMCCPLIYPNLNRLLYIIASFPVSVASAERSFSKLRRPKTWLRSMMGQDRLCGLALLNIHREIVIPVDSVIQNFAKMKKRKIELLM